MKSAIPRASRAALFGSLAFFLADRLTHNRDLTAFAGYGCLSNLIFVEFGGTFRQRLAQASELAAVGVVVSVIGTVASISVIVSGLFMAIVTFFAFAIGALKPSVAKVTTPILIAAILPLTSRQSVDHVGGRAIVWAAGAFAAVCATGLFWPIKTSPEEEKLSTIDAARQAAASLRAKDMGQFLNPIRTSVALAMSIVVSDLLGVDHAFWVVVGTLASLCSNFAGTEKNALQVVLGTAAGIAISELLIAGVPSFFWFALPGAIFATGIGSKISLAATQAGFTVLLILVSCLVGSAEFKLGVVRAENIALGIAVSLVVSMLIRARIPAPAPTQVGV